MAGAIGLTQAGQYLDLLLEEDNPPYKYKILGFITKLTSRCHRFRRQLKLFEYRSDAEMVFTYLRKEYLGMLKKNYRDIDEQYYSLMRNYIITLTQLDFQPTSKTQIALKNRVNR